MEGDILVCKAIIYVYLALQIFFCSLFQCHWTLILSTNQFDHGRSTEPDITYYRSLIAYLMLLRNAIIRTEDKYTG